MPSKVHQNGPTMEPEMSPKWDQESTPKGLPKGTKTSPRKAPKNMCFLVFWLQREAQAVPQKGLQNDPKTSPNFAQMDPKMDPNMDQICKSLKQIGPKGGIALKQ